MNKCPRITQFMLTINMSKPGPAGIRFEELEKKLGEKYSKFAEIFGEGQTCGENGAYLSDVESVLERMESGKLTGSQLLWD